ncbi:MAG: hypothetical protein VR77_09260 [Flavobacteriales bacterium BRH_c54]|nr:MAG: hypothetical protein VR77_09260 [Flavobacteriales bacterium BRH_c54]
MIFLNCSNTQGVKNQEENNAVDKLQKMALEYTPINSGKPSQLPEIDSEQKKYIINAVSIDKNASEQYITLIILKLYRSHLECCNQAYEIRKTNIIDKEEQPLLYQFIILSNIIDVNEIKEFLPSSIGYDFVMEKPSLRKYKAIDNEMNTINRILKRIKKGDL